ncbi:MAG: hypothetical protein ACLGIA_13490 [Actinomycetes bacterium]
MQLELTEEEAAVLQEVVTNHLREMSSEIRHTDNREFRDSLRERREVLRRLSARLEPVPAV